MADDGGISGAGLAVVLAGSLLVYAAVKKMTIADAVRSIAKGTAPSGIEQTQGILPSQMQHGEHGGPGQTGSANQAMTRLLAAPYGWSSGAEWDALVNLWTRESGFNNLIANPSGAFGIAQALGHGTNSSAANNVTYEVSGGGGVTTGTVNEYPNQAANAGDPASQILWGLNYIKQQYGDPVNAWAHETSQGWY